MKIKNRIHTGSKRIALYMMGVVLLAITLAPSLPAARAYAVNVPPQSQADCTNIQYFEPAVADNANIQGHPARCINKVDKPRDAADCPAGYTYQPPSGVSVPIPAKCVKNTPVTAADCTAIQYFVPETFTNANNIGRAAHCANKLDNPRDAADCPAGYTYVPATTGTNQQPAKCAATSVVAPTDPAGSTTDPSVECHVDINPLTWFLCPIIKGINSMINQLDNLITNLLTIDQAKIFDTSSADAATKASASGYYSAWQTFRGFALAILLIAGLMMVIAQALGFQILDAYTIKKVLPRLIFAVIGIALSWDLMHFFVIFTNDLGLGVRHIIYYPFRNVAGSVQLGGGAQLGLALVSGVAITALGIVGLLSFVLTAVLALVVAFLVLIIRQLVVVLLILFAPVAIACSILPNTQSVFKLWHESFSKAMMMFPIIMGFLAIGRVFAVTSVGSDVSGAPAISQLIGFASYFLPYFLIPATFKLAGGALRTIGGSVNDRSKGGFDRLKKFRGGKIAQNSHAMKTGTRFEGSKFVPGTRTLAKGFNQTTIGLGTGAKGHFGLGRRGSSAIDQTRRIASGDLMKDPRQNAIKDDDNSLRAQSYKDEVQAFAGVRDFLANKDKDPTMSFAQKQEKHSAEAKRAVASVKAATGFGKVQQFTAAQQMVNTGTGFTDIEDMAKTLARASGGNSSTATSLAGYANSATKQAGRHDLAPSFGKLNELVQAESATLRSGGATPPPAPGLYDEAKEAAWGSASLYQHANDKGANISAAIDHFSPMLTNPDKDKREKAAVFFNEIRSMQPNASGDVKDRIQQAIEDPIIRANINALYDTVTPSPLVLPASPAGVADKAVGRVEQSLLDPLTGTRTKTYTPPTGYVPEAPKDRVERKSRTYERPDPHNM